MLHLADLHLGWQPRLPGTAGVLWQKERDQLLKRAVDFALSPSNGVHLVVIAGDLFESHRPDQYFVRNVIAELQRLTAAGIGVVTVPGNHDEITYHDSVYRRYAADWPGVLVTNPMPEHVATLELDGLPVHFYSLAYTGGLTRTTPPIDAFPRATDPGIHIGVFHGSLDWDAGDRSLPIRSEALAQAGYQYVALGHIHQHQMRRVQQTTIVYAGAVEGKGFFDPGVGHWTVAEIDPVARETKVHKIPVPVKPIRTETLDVGRLGSAEELHDAIKLMVHQDLMLQIRLTGSPSWPVDVDEVADRFGSLFFHLDIADDTEFYSGHHLDAYVHEMSVRGEFVRRMRARLQSAADPDEKRIVERALRVGLTALDKGVR